jgi:carbon monoxide dehydrogenase subunit G
MKIETGVKTVNYPQETVYAKISDLTNLKSIKEKFNNPELQEKMKAETSGEKIEQIGKTLETLEFDTDSVSMDVKPVGRVSISIIEREQPKLIKFSSTQSPVGFKMWVQLLPVTDDTCKMKITVDASVNPFVGAMIEKPLREGAEKLADMLSKLPYE